VRKPNKQPLSKDDFLSPMMTDLSVKSMVENTVSVFTTAAEDTKTGRMVTSRLRANNNTKRLNIVETMRVLEGLESNAALLQEENKTFFSCTRTSALSPPAAWLRQPQSTVSSRRHHPPPNVTTCYARRTKR